MAVGGGHFNLFLDMLRSAPPRLNFNSGEIT